MAPFVIHVGVKIGLRGGWWGCLVTETWRDSFLSCSKYWSGGENGI